MGKITFIEHDQTEHVAEFKAGSSVMQIAVDNLIPGIDGDFADNTGLKTPLKAFIYLFTCSQAPEAVKVFKKQGKAPFFTTKKQQLTVLFALFCMIPESVSL